MDEIIWRGMTRTQLDAAYNNTAAVRNSADKLADWIERSKTVRAERSELLAPHISAFGGKADMSNASPNVCFLSAISA
jgi:hypothetical protein